ASGMPTFDATNNTYTFKVLPGLKWSDGTPITASTFAYSINRSLNPCTGSTLGAYLYPIKDAQAFNSETCAADGTTIVGKIQTLIGDSINATDAQTLVITLNGPTPYFLDGFTYPTTDAVPEQLIDRYGLKNWTSHLTDGGGFSGNLYKLTFWSHTGELDLTANSSFWGTQPKLKQIDLHAYPSTDALYTTYLDGGLDLGVPPSDQFKRAMARPDFHQVPFLAISYYQPDWTIAPFNDVRVRQAFDLALNKSLLANQITQGRDFATNQIIPKGMTGYNPSITGPDGTTNLTGNQAKATALMQAYANDKCGGKFSACPPVTLTTENDPGNETYAQAAVQEWQVAFPAYPIKTQFEDFNTLINQIYSATPPQFFGIAWAADYNDEQDFLSLQFLPSSPNNNGHVDVPQANTLMMEADVDLNPTTRAQLYNQAEQLLVDQVAWLPIFQQQTNYNLPSYVHNLAYNTLQEIPLTNWQTIYLTTR
ncbi:MAG: ABC transporter substrate-binding protein, partial [Ktedonobacterales bacterium]